MVEKIQIVRDVEAIYLYQGPKPSVAESKIRFIVLTPEQCRESLSKSNSLFLLSLFLVSCRQGLNQPPAFVLKRIIYWHAGRYV